MRVTRRIMPLLLVAGLPLAGCLLTSGQFLVSVDLLPGQPIVATNPGVVPIPVDLTTEDVYNDYKENLVSVADLALLGEVTNSGATAASVTFYMTPEATTYTEAGAVLADPTTIAVWGPFSAAAGETKRIDWNDSAGLFVGRQAVLDELKGDGKFTFYAIGTVGASATISEGILVLVIDAGM